MSRISLAALALTLAALGFGVGYHTGLSREQPRGVPTRAPQGGAPPATDGVSAAVQEALAHPDQLERTVEITRVLQRLGPESIGEVTTAYDAAFVEAGDVAIVLLAKWWARHDPAGAFEWAWRNRLGSTPAFMTAVVRTWAERNPEEAARAIEEIANAELRRATVDALVRGWDDSGEPGLLDYLADLPSAPDRQLSIALLARRKVHREGLEQTFRWAEALPDDTGRFKLNVFRRVASAAVEVDPQRAAAWATRHSAGDYGKGLFRRVGVRWATQDGAAAMKWLATLPAGGERDTGVQETYRTWLSRDHEAAMAWMRSAELEPWLEPALALFALSLSQQSPEGALEWTALIHDAARRREATMKIGRYWHQVDPDAARPWLDGSGLSEKDQEWILSPPRESRGRGGAPRQRDVPLRQEREG